MDEKVFLRQLVAAVCKFLNEPNSINMAALEVLVEIYTKEPCDQ